MSQARMGDSLALALALEGKTVAHGETAELVALAGQLATLPDPEINAAFADALEAQLLGLEETAIQTPRLTVVPQPQPQSKPEPRRQNVVTLPRRRVVVKRWVASVAAAAMLGAFPLAAAASSLPGSPAYGLKLGIERVQLALFGTPVEDAFTHLKLANTRISEADQLAAMGGRADLIAATLKAAEGNIQTAGRLVLGATSNPTTLGRFADMALATGDDIGDVGEAAPGAKHAADSALDAVQAVVDMVNAAMAPATSVEFLPKLQTPTVEAPAAQAPEQSTSSSTEVKSPSDGGSSGGNSSSGSVEQPGGNKGGKGKLSEDPGDVGCSAPGSENGTGDLFAPVVRVFCG